MIYCSLTPCFEVRKGSIFVLGIRKGLTPGGASFYEMSLMELPPPSQEIAWEQLHLLFNELIVTVYYKCPWVKTKTTTAATVKARYVDESQSRSLIVISRTNHDFWPHPHQYLFETHTSFIRFCWPFGTTTVGKKGSLSIKKKFSKPLPKVETFWCGWQKRSFTKHWQHAQLMTQSLVVLVVPVVVPVKHAHKTAKRSAKA